MMKFNDGKHIAQVVSRTPCKTHQRPIGAPCWDVYLDTVKGEVTRAVCGSRIRSAGFIGTISETSVQSKRKAAEANQKEVFA